LSENLVSPGIEPGPLDLKPRTLTTRPQRQIIIIITRNAHRLLVGEPEGKRPLGRPRPRWVDNIRMDLGEVGWGDVDWIGLAKDRNRWRAVLNSVLNLRVP
jgi:hypothetical protein